MQMRALTEPVGLSLPDEAVVWWSYHDGTDAPEGMPSRAISPSQTLLSLEEALSRRRMLRDVNRVTGDQVRGKGKLWPELWEDTWLPILTWDGPTIVIDCADNCGRITPIRRIEFGDLSSEQIHEIRAPSIGAMVHMWIGAIREHVWKWDTATGNWSYDYVKDMPLDWKLTAFM